MKCSPESSLMFSSPKVTGSEFNGTLPDDITNIALYSLSSSLDVEYVIVNSDNSEKKKYGKYTNMARI